MRKKETERNEITIRSSAAEYLTFVAAGGEAAESYEIRYEDENIWLTQNMRNTELFRTICSKEISIVSCRK